MSDHGFEFASGDSPLERPPRRTSYALVLSNEYDQPPGMTIGCDPLTELEWRRPDGTLLRSAVVGGAGRIQVLLRQGPHQVREPYDLYVREPGSTWRRIYEFRPQLPGCILVTNVEDRT